MRWETAHVAIIGAEGGIGKQLYTQLAERGTTVHSLDLSSGFDATDPQHCSDFFGDHTEIDTVIYAAGIALSGELTAPGGQNSVLETVTTNVAGLINVARSSRPALQDHKGRLIALNSAFSLVTAHGFAAYSCSKAALTMACEGLRPELSPATVTDCLLGGVDTPIFRTAAQQSGTPAAHEISKRFTRRIARATPEKAARDILSAAGKRRRRPRIGLDAQAVSVASQIAPFLTRRAIMRVVGPYPNAI